MNSNQFLWLTANQGFRQRQRLNTRIQPKLWPKSLHFPKNLVLALAIYIAWMNIAQFNLIKEIFDVGKLFGCLATVLSMISLTFDICSFCTFGSHYSLQSSWVWWHKLWTSWFGDILYIYIYIFISFLTLNVDRWWTDIFRSLQRESVSCLLWFGCVCLGSLSCQKVNLWPSLSSWAHTLCSVGFSLIPDGAKKMFEVAT